MMRRLSKILLDHDTSSAHSDGQAKRTPELDLRVILVKQHDSTYICSNILCEDHDARNMTLHLWRV